MLASFLIGTETFTRTELLNAPLPDEWKAWVANARPGDSMENVACISVDLSLAINRVLALHPYTTPEELQQEAAELIADDVLAFGRNLALH